MLTFPKMHLSEEEATCRIPFPASPFMIACICLDRSEKNNSHLSQNLVGAWPWSVKSFTVTEKIYNTSVGAQKMSNYNNEVA